MNIRAERLAKIESRRFASVKESGALAASGTQPAMISWPLLNGREMRAKVDDQGGSGLYLIP